MKKKVLEREAYISPQIEVIYLLQPHSLLAGSPNAGSGTTVVPPKNEDEEVSGAKGFMLWGEEEQEEVFND